MLQWVIVNAKKCVPATPHTIGEGVVKEYCVSLWACLDRTNTSSFISCEDGSHEEPTESMCVESATLDMIYHDTT